jgi:peptidoglycan-associated lipoprotein
MKHLFPAFCWAVIAGGMIGACAKKPRVTNIESAQAATNTNQEGQTMQDPNETILDLDAPNWTIYFGFDSFALREVYKVAALGKWMMANGSKVSLSGFTSEEGTDEYNLALGARRAKAVRDYLEAYGVPVERISWQSYGEENQVTTDRTKFHLNRRVEIKIEGVN